MGSGEHRGAVAAQLDRIKGVLDGLVERNVPGDHGDRFDVDVGIAQRHDQRHGVVRSRGAVNENASDHARNGTSCWAWGGV